MKVRTRFELLRLVVCCRPLLTLSVVLIFSCCTTARAQTETGWIQGKVTDKITLSGIENVEVVIVDADGVQGLRSTTNAFGEFILAGISAGGYELRIVKDPYPEYRLRALEVRGGCGSLADLRIEEKPTE